MIIRLITKACIYGSRLNLSLSEVLIPMVNDRPLGIEGHMGISQFITCSFWLRFVNIVGRSYGTGVIMERKKDIENEWNYGYVGTLTKIFYVQHIDPLDIQTSPKNI
jgi:hypothetical protein